MLIQHQTEQEWIKYKGSIAADFHTAMLCSIQMCNLNEFHGIDLDQIAYGTLFNGQYNLFELEK